VDALDYSAKQHIGAPRVALDPSRDDAALALSAGFSVAPRTYRTVAERLQTS
jgi:hypothetical protein